MKLIVAGGCGEHGRNCFYIQGESLSFMVDCGNMAGEYPGLPRLTAQMIKKRRFVFLTHSHADHTGALPRLIENSFAGYIVATRRTCEQLRFDLRRTIILEDICPGGRGSLDFIGIEWGRSGHCRGSVWYRFSAEGKKLFFSGDYNENSRVYPVDPVRGASADIAVIDCAYGREEYTHRQYLEKLSAGCAALAQKHPVLLFPVPKYGRGLDLFRLMSRQFPEADIYLDENLKSEVKNSFADRFWYRGNLKFIRAAGIESRRRESRNLKIILVGDPQLKTEIGRDRAERALRRGGKAVLTGTVEKGSFSQKLLDRGSACLLRYPVHQNRRDFDKLLENNNFKKAIPFHTRDYRAQREYETE